ncbi:MAG: hypothetical protein ACRDR6_24670 [Pseudonocardiaceae bacterium]
MIAVYVPETTRDVADGTQATIMSGSASPRRVSFGVRTFIRRLRGVGAVDAPGGVGRDELLVGGQSSGWQFGDREPFGFQDFQ